MNALQKGPPGAGELIRREHTLCMQETQSDQAPDGPSTLPGATLESNPGVASCGSPDNQQHGSSSRSTGRWGGCSLGHREAVSRMRRGRQGAAGGPGPVWSRVRVGKGTP